MMLKEIIEADEVEERQEEVNELLVFIIKVKVLLKTLNDSQKEDLSS